jgi:flavin-dependent dehydrogenase
LERAVTQEFDVAVMGGGPAGAITALCLSRLGWRVGIFESTAFDQDRFGETLPPELNPVLRRLGLWEAFLSQSPLESPGTISQWGGAVPAETDFTSNAFGCGWHIDRNRFDKALCTAAVEAGASLFLNHRVKWSRDSGAWCAEDLRAKLLVNASGRNGLRLDGAGEREREDELLAIVMRIVDGKGTQRDQRTLIETAPAGWWYSTLLPDGNGLAMFFTGAEVYRQDGISIRDQLHSAPLTRARLDSGRIAEPKIVHALSALSKTIVGEDWVSVGDSASSYDPLSGRGIFKAFRHGEAAAAAIDAKLRGDAQAMDRYAAQVRREFAEYARQRRQYYAMEQRWADQPFWRARQVEHGGGVTRKSGPA